MANEKSTEDYYVDASNYVGLTCEIADWVLQERMGKYYDSLIEHEDGGGTRYTENGQDAFEEILGEVEDLLSVHDIHHENCCE